MMNSVVVVRVGVRSVDDDWVESTVEGDIVDVVELIVELSNGEASNG